VYKIIGGDGEEYGPVDAAQIEEWIRVNRVNGQTFAQPTGRSDWQPLSSFPEFADSFVVQPPDLPSVGLKRPLSSDKVPSYFLPAILCTLFCCLLGAPAIVYAAQANSRQAEGDIAGALKAARQARAWCWIAFGLGVVSSILGSMFAARLFPNR
jgi:hypothetical protein